MGSFKSLLTGIALGATAVFLSEKKNRDKVVKKGRQLKAAAEKEYKELRAGAAKTVTNLKETVKKAAK